MRLNSIKSAAIVLAAWTSIAAAAQASHCGACRLSSCCPPPAKYRVCYQTVWEERTRTCYRPVYTTTYQ